MKTQYDTLYPAIVSISTSLFLCLILFCSLRDRLIAMLGSKLERLELNCKLSASDSFFFQIKDKNPRWVILCFPRGIGFYNGEISIKNGDKQVGYYQLPVIEEFANKYLGIHNTAITRSRRIITIRIHDCTTQSPLVLSVKLNSNVSDPQLVTALQVMPEAKIEATFRG